jgi:hypothetical protein
MKKFCFLLCAALTMAGLAIFFSCSSEGDGQVVTDADSSAACLACHSGDTETGDKILGAKAQYDNSGHYNGPRELVPASINSGHLYAFHGSNAPYTNANPCQQCHAHKGFVEYAETGTTTSADETPAPIGCFSCHKPHETGDFNLRTTSAVTLTGGGTFNVGKGNLCATCHHARRDTSSEIDPTDFTDKGVGGAFAGIATTSLSSPWGPHHGPQADFLMGAANWDSGSSTVGASPHATGNSCVKCHHYQPDGRLGGNLELGGHGFYLTSEVHGSREDLIANCETCHTASNFYNSLDDPETEGFIYINKTAAYDWDGDGTTERILIEIQGMRDTLVGYFGTGSNFLKKTLNTPVPDPTDDDTWTYTYALGTSGDGPVVDSNSSSRADVDTATNGYEWGESWEFAEAEMSQVQAEAYWNFKYFMEDRSGGIHNPTFAAQILWDAIKHLNDDAGAGLTLGGTRPF